MRLTFAQEQAVSELGKHLYHFLPGQAHPYADQSISFQGAAKATGVGQFWQGGSKQPATVALLRNTLENKADRFCDLINAIVRKALAYRQNKNEPLTREDVQTLNDLLFKLGFKIPELRDPKFVDGLPSVNRSPSVTSFSQDKRNTMLAQLRKLSSLAPQSRGYAFEEFLKDLFSFSNLVSCPSDS